MSQERLLTKHLATMMRQAVDSELPEDEPNDVREWVYETCAKTAFRYLAPDVFKPRRERERALLEPSKPLPNSLSFMAAAGEFDLGGKETGLCVVCQKSCELLDGSPAGRLLMKRYPGGWRRAGVVCEPHALDLRALFP